jgi:hypothetical protein
LKSVPYKKQSLSKVIRTYIGLYNIKNWYFSGTIWIGNIIALPYSIRMSITLYKCSISLKNTVKVANIRPIPMMNIENNIIGTTPSNIYKVKGACVANMTRKRTTNESKKVIKPEIVTPMIYIYLGT